MNVTELSRKLGIQSKKMLEILPQYGFDIGVKAVKCSLGDADFRGHIIHQNFVEALLGKKPRRVLQYL